MTRKLRSRETRFYYPRRGFGLESSFEPHIFLHSRTDLFMSTLNLEEKDGSLSLPPSFFLCFLLFLFFFWFEDELGKEILLL